MKSWHFSLISLLAAGAILSACSKEEAPVEPAATPEVAAPAAAEAPAAGVGARGVSMVGLWT